MRYTPKLAKSDIQMLLFEQQEENGRHRQRNGKSAIDMRMLPAILSDIGYGMIS